MKQKMKHLMSFIALLVMLISMFSICVFPAAAADEYVNMLRDALVVNPLWADYDEGEYIEYTFRGEQYAGSFNSESHFASFADAWAWVKETKMQNPVILLCAGDYTEELKMDSEVTSVTLLGPNAGIDPNKKSADKKVAWTLSENRVDATEAKIRHNIYVGNAMGSANITIDGLYFTEAINDAESQRGIGGALVDYERGNGQTAGTLTSNIDIKNTVFYYAGNDREIGGARGYTLYLRSTGCSRTLNLQNLYIYGENDVRSIAGPALGFISPFFTNLKADNIAYLESKNGFLAKTWFALTVSPRVEITNSCFHNSKAAIPEGYVISMDNHAMDYDFKTNTDKAYSTANDRPAASLKLQDNVFYNASGASGLIHYEFTSASAVLDIQNNYIYQNDNNANNGASVMDAEFVDRSTTVDMTSSIVIKNNQLIGAYKIPNMINSSESTYLDMSDNYFGNTLGQCVYQPIYVNESETRLKRNSFWVNEAMTISNEDWYLSIDNWDLAWVDDSNYTAKMVVFAEKSIEDVPIKYTSSNGFTVQLYSSVNTTTPDGVITDVHDYSIVKDNILTSVELGIDNPYETTTVYAKITNPQYPEFAPVYTITVENMGTTADVKDFADAFGEDVFLYKSDLDEVTAGEKMPYVWKDTVYMCTIGVNLFGSIEKLIKYANSKGIVEPVILIPAGDYYDELVLTGSCVLRGEQYGINPNLKPIEKGDITQANLDKSPWTVNPARNANRETAFYACIRVAEGADNYKITLDGIKMGPGCSYVDDFARTGKTVTVFKNVYVDNAGGGLNRNGAVNGYVFNFNKAYDINATDHCTIELIDTRIENLSGRIAFGPYVEHFLMDGVFFGNNINGSKLMAAICSRDVANPYYGIKNCYLYNNNGSGQRSLYMIQTADHTGTIEKKLNVVYEFDNNVFYNAFANGYGAMDISFIGNSMKFYLTNNIMVHTTNSGVLFTSSSAYPRFRGSCSRENVSDMLICRGNRIVGQRKLPNTAGVGNGTMFDFSGNYFANAISGEGLTPKDALVTEVTSANTGNYTYEACTRNKIDYTYLDWDMTIKSNEASGPAPTKVDYTINSGMYGTGRYAAESDGIVYRDTTPAECTVYNNPVNAGHGFSVKLYDSDMTEISSLALTGPTNTFYCIVSSADGSLSETITLVIERKVGMQCNLLGIDDFHVGQDAIVGYLDEIWNTYLLSAANITVSAGATYEWFADAECTTPANSKVAQGANVAYLKVTNEKNTASRVYALTLKNKKSVAAGSAAEAGLVGISGALRTDSAEFEAQISQSRNSFEFAITPVYGAKVLKVTSGSATLTADASGKYTLATPGTVDHTVKVLVSSGNGFSQAEYILTVKKIPSNSCELEKLQFDACLPNGLGTASKFASGYGINLAHAATAKIIATVSEGATYAVYEDAACTKLCKNNIVNTYRNGKYEDGFTVYLKVTAEDGNTSKDYNITVWSNAGNRDIATIVGEVKSGNNTVTYRADTNGDTVYELYLPAGTKSVALTGSVALTLGTQVDGGTVSFFADPGRRVPVVADSNKKVTINLNQKVTRVYTSTVKALYTELDSAGNKLYVETTPKNGVLYIYTDVAASNYKDAATYKNQWMQTYVDYLNNNNYGIFKGDENGKLNINDNITRYEIAAVATRVLGLDVNLFTNNYAPTNYADTIEDWAKPYVRAAASVGIMNGHKEGEKLYFDGNAYATREQVIKVLVSVCVINKGVSGGNDANNTDAATVYYNQNKTTVDLAFGKYKFEDTASVSDWAVPYIRLAVGEFKMIGGSLEGNKLYLFPGKNITRAEVAKMVAVYFGHA